jgi:hypothetical protein
MASRCREVIGRDTGTVTYLDFTLHAQFGSKFSVPLDEVGAFTLAKGAEFAINNKN